MSAPPIKKPLHGPDDVRKALESSNGIIVAAAADLGVTSRTLHNYLERWPELRETIDQQRAKRTALAEGKFVSAIRAGEPWAIKFELTTSDHPQYSRARETRVSGRIEHTHEHRVSVRQEVIDALPLEKRVELIEITKQLAAAEEDESNPRPELRVVEEPIN